MKVSSAIWLIVLLCWSAGCTSGKTITVSTLNCEDDGSGSFVCDVQGKRIVGRFCLYDVDRASGSDCASLRITTGSTVCVLCDSAQTQCPPKVVFKVKDKDCTLKVFRISSRCTTCVQQGIPVQPAN